MGSRIMHLAIADSILKQCPLSDKNRFLLGSVVPDAVVSGNSHRKIVLPGSGKRTYDLSGFREQFSGRLRSDALYLGFYLHLLQDLVFRHFVYAVHHWDPAPEGNVDRLHNDYAIINSYIVRKYGLSPVAGIPDRIEEEPLLSGCRYDVSGFIQGLNSDFERKQEGSIFFFRESMADECITMSVPVCLSEIRALQEGSGFADEHAWAWTR